MGGSGRFARHREQHVGRSHHGREALVGLAGNAHRYLRAARLVQRLGQLLAQLAGAQTVSFHGDRLAVVPIELDSRRAKRLREELPDALYESGRSQVSMRVPKDGTERFPRVVRAADVLLSIMREAA